MIYGIGTDLCEVERIKNSIEKYGDKFLRRIFTAKEIEYCLSYNEQKYVHFAARFAVKEAFSKAIGTGFTKGFVLNEVGIINEKSGKPIIELSGILYEKYGSYNAFVSISHTTSIASAYVILEKI